MTSASWKDHERAVAEFFNTKRGVRGNDFGEKGVEVKASLSQWLGWPGKYGIIAECKYSKKHAIVDICKDKLGKRGYTLYRLGSYIMVWLDDFTDFFTNMVHVDQSELCITWLSETYNIVILDKEEPQYLRDYRAQAVEYTEMYKSEGTFLPIACIAKAKAKRRLVSINVNDLTEYIESVRTEIGFPSSDTSTPSASNGSTDSKGSGERIPLIPNPKA